MAYGPHGYFDDIILQGSTMLGRSIMTCERGENQNCVYTRSQLPNVELYAILCIYAGSTEGYCKVTLNSLKTVFILLCDSSFLVAQGLVQVVIRVLWGIQNLSNTPRDA